MKIVKLIIVICYPLMHQLNNVLKLTYLHFTSIEFVTMIAVNVGFVLTSILSVFGIIKLNRNSKRYIWLFKAFTIVLVIAFCFFEPINGDLHFIGFQPITLIKTLLIVIFLLFMEILVSMFSDN